MDNEIWKPIKGFEGYYEISNKGNVKSLSRIIKRRTGNLIIKEKIMKLHKSPHGYIKIVLYKDGAWTVFYVHRLVAEAFLENPHNKTDVDHINTIRDDNRVENLRWCTRSENNYNPITNKRMSLSLKGRIRTEESIAKWKKAREAKGWKIKKKLNNGKSKAVVQIDPSDNSVIKTFPSMQEVKRQLGFSPACICNCCKGKLETAYGFIWKYYTESPPCITQTTLLPKMILTT